MLKKMTNSDELKKKFPQPGHVNALIICRKLVFHSNVLEVFFVYKVLETAISYQMHIRYTLLKK